MRDKSLTLKQFHIQLEKVVRRKFPTDDWFLRNHVSDSPTLSSELEDYRIFYPRNFRLLRSLAILQWYFPEALHWRILLDLKDLTLSQFNEKQKIEISLLLEEREICERYLYESKRFTSEELFGNILGNDLEDLKGVLRISKKRKTKPKRKVRRRGYRDHGSKRPDHKWLPSFDESLTEMQLLKEKIFLRRTRTVQILINILRTLDIV